MPTPNAERVLIYPLFLICPLPGLACYNLPAGHLENQVEVCQEH
jgi:hypothetical protein